MSTDINYTYDLNQPLNFYFCKPPQPFATPLNAWFVLNLKEILNNDDYNRLNIKEEYEHFNNYLNNECNNYKDDYIFRNCYCTDDCPIKYYDSEKVNYHFNNYIKNLMMLNIIPRQISVDIKY